MKIIMLQFLWITSPSIPDESRNYCKTLCQKHRLLALNTKGTPVGQRSQFSLQLDARDLSVVGCEKINTSGYHTQTDGLVVKFNSTLIKMIAKSCETKDRDWDEHLPYLPFAYRVSSQDSTKSLLSSCYMGDTLTFLQ